MNVAVKWGLILGVVVGLLGFVMAGAALHTGPTTALAFVALAMLTNIVVIVLALRAGVETNGWQAQMVTGIVVGLVGGAIIFASSWVMTAVVFPDYYAEMREGYLAFFEDAGMTDEQIDQQMAQFDKATPVSSAMQGAIGTIVTSVVVAAIAGAFIRKK